MNRELDKKHGKMLYVSLLPLPPLSPSEWPFFPFILMLASSSLPNRFSHWVRGGLLGLLVLAVGPALWALLPPREPLTVPSTSIVSEVMSNGRWRITRTVVMREICESLTISRRFTGELGGKSKVDLRVSAVASSRTSLEPVFVPKMSRVAGEPYEDWLEYEIIPGFKGSYIVTVAASECPSGYNGVFTLYVAPVDWTGYVK